MLTLKGTFAIFDMRCQNADDLIKQQYVEKCQKS